MSQTRFPQVFHYDEESWAELHRQVQQATWSINIPQQHANSDAVYETPAQIRYHLITVVITL